jgi:hypothetical protein
MMTETSCSKQQEATFFYYDGATGPKGENGWNSVEKIEPVFDSISGKTGTKISFFWDNDEIAGYSIGDSTKNTFYISWNGLDGKAGNSPVLYYGTISSSTCPSGKQNYFVSFLDGEQQGDTLFNCVATDGNNGNDGLDGITPTIKQIYCSNGIVYQWWVGEEKKSDDFFPYAINGVDGHDGTDGVDGTDGTNGENGQDGKDAPIGTSIACLTQHFNFQGVNSSYFSNTGITVTGSFNYSASDGALYCSSNGGSITLPPTTANNKLLYSSFKYGSKKPFQITVKVIHYDGTEETISNFTYAGNSGFVRNTFATYGKFEYKADLSNIKFSDVKNIRLEVSKTSTTKCDDNIDFFVDDFINVVGF